MYRINFLFALAFQFFPLRLAQPQVIGLHTFGVADRPVGDHFPCRHGNTGGPLVHPMLRRRYHAIAQRCLGYQTSVANQIYFAFHLGQFRTQICQLVAGESAEDMPRTILNIDCAISPEMLTLSGIQALDVMEPCGNGCPKPVLMMENMIVTSVGA